MVGEYLFSYIVEPSIIFFPIFDKALFLQIIAFNELMEFFVKFTIFTITIFIGFLELENLAFVGLEHLAGF